jgi:hypothetical protein
VKPTAMSLKGSSTSFQAQAAHFRFSPDFGHIAASRRQATKSADALRSAADGAELRQAAGAAAPHTLTLHRFAFALFIQRRWHRGHATSESSPSSPKFPQRVLPLNDLHDVVADSIVRLLGPIKLPYHFHVARPFFQNEVVRCMAHHLQMTDMFLKKFLYTRILQLQLVETLHQNEQSREPVKQKRFELPPIVLRQSLQAGLVLLYHRMHCVAHIWARNRSGIRWAI